MPYIMVDMKARKRKDRWAEVARMVGWGFVVLGVVCGFMGALLVGIELRLG